MKILISTLSLLSSISAFSDQTATWTCTGDYVKISEQSPYLGEGSPYAQKLYTLTQKVGGEFNSSEYTAFFLTSNSKRTGSDSLTIQGKNGKSGSFTLQITSIVDKSDGVDIHREGNGVLTYSHGPLSGKENVNCTLE